MLRTCFRIQHETLVHYMKSRIAHQYPDHFVCKTCCLFSLDMYSSQLCLQQLLQCSPLIYIVGSCYKYVVCIFSPPGAIHTNHSRPTSSVSQIMFYCLCSCVKFFLLFFSNDAHLADCLLQGMTSLFLKGLFTIFYFRSDLIF